MFKLSSLGMGVYHHILNKVFKPINKYSNSESLYYSPLLTQMTDLAEDPTEEETILKHIPCLSCRATTLTSPIR